MKTNVFIKLLNWYSNTKDKISLYFSTKKDKLLHSFLLKQLTYVALILYLYDIISLIWVLLFSLIIAIINEIIDYYYRKTGFDLEDIFYSSVDGIILFIIYSLINL